jgi:hypothetical protein
MALSSASVLFMAFHAKNSPVNKEVIGMATMLFRELLAQWEGRWT